MKPSKRIRQIALDIHENLVRDSGSRYPVSFDHCCWLAVVAYLDEQAEQAKVELLWNYSEFTIVGGYSKQRRPRIIKRCPRICDFIPATNPWAWGVYLA